MNRHFSCRQVLENKNSSEDDWTENTISASSEEEAAEKFCKGYVMEGEPPYRVQVQSDRSAGAIEFSTWRVVRVMEPVFHANEIK